MLLQSEAFYVIICVSFALILRGVI